MRNVVFSLIAVLIVTADQLTKMWVRSYADGQVIFEAGPFRLVNIHNTGAAFGLFRGQSFALTIFALIGIIVLLVFTFILYHRFAFLDCRLSKPALALILGGAVGNLVDRLSLGQVTDFIGISIWPSFNIADSSIVIGVILFGYSILSTSRTRENLRG